MSQSEDQVFAKGYEPGEGTARTPAPQSPEPAPDESDFHYPSLLWEVSPEAYDQLWKAGTTDSERPLDPKLVELYREVERFIQNGSRRD